MSKSDFTLVDLGSQANEFWHYVQGWTADEILYWLRMHGTVRSISHPMDTRLFTFRSAAGIETGFRLTEDGQLYILGDHTMRKPK